MSDKSSKADNAEATVPDPQAVPSESNVQENAGKCEGEQSQEAAVDSTEKVNTAVEKSDVSGSAETDVKEKGAAANEENVECVSFAKEWEQMRTAVKHPSAPSTSEVRQSVEAGQPRPPQRPDTRPRPAARRRPREETADCRTFCIPVYYWKAILGFTVIILALTCLIYIGHYLYRSPTHEDRMYNGYVALICGTLAAFFGIIVCYLELRTINIFWCCRELLRRHLQSARDNNPYRVVNFQGTPNETAQGDIESRITEAEMDVDIPKTENSGEGKSVSPKETGDGQRMSTDKDTIFSSPISDEKSSKIKEVASVVTSIVSETLKKGDKEKLAESSDSKEGSVEVSTSTETSSEALMESGEIRRRKFGNSDQSSAPPSSDEDSTKKD